MEEIQEELQEALYTLTKDDNRKCFQEWDKCIASQGQHFEGDSKGTTERFIISFFFLNNSRKFGSPLYVKGKDKCLKSH